MAARSRAMGVAMVLAGSTLVAAAGFLLLAGGPGDDATVRDALEDLTALPYLQWKPVAPEDHGKLGVTRWDRERAWNGLNVYCTEGRPGGRVIDMEGLQVLPLPDRRRDPEDCRLLEPAGDGGWIMLTVEGSLLLLDPEGRIELAENRSFHHDATLAADGVVYGLAERERFLSPLAGLRPIRDNLLVLMDRRGRPRREISLAELVAKDPALRRLVAERRIKYPLSLFDNPLNANTIEVVAADVLRDGRRLFRRGDVLICLRNIDLVGVLDPESERFLWTWGPGDLEHPHHPSLLPGGNLLIFDNGRYRGWSRVIELDPATRTIVWEYRGDPPESFYSQSRGAAQRLANGNTLITQSEAGRVFEVTREGEIVWEFWESAVRDGGGGGAERATIYRMMRVDAGSLSARVTAASDS